MTNQIAITAFERYQSGWEWKFTVTDEFTGERRAYHYHTNQVGEGVFSANPQTGEMFVHQLRGTQQFTLNGDSRDQARRTVRRWLKRQFA